MNISTELLEKFAHDSGIEIWGLAHIPDDWINQLKVYYKIDLKEQTGLFYVWTEAFYIELLLARIEDLLTDAESHAVEKTAIDSLLHMTSLLAKNEKHDKEASDYVSDLIYGYIDNSRKEQKKHGVTITDAFTKCLAKTHIYGKIPKVILMKYIESKIELFEEQNFRKKLVRMSE
jgi:hypothetical protein